MDDSPSSAEAAFLTALEAALPSTRPWRPYPWQVPPGPVATQGAFLIEGGRGIGKTDGCAHYVEAHVQGPPCDPRIPGGHRIAIFAPTLDDAAESCVTGPSGLKAYNPAVILRTALGGSKVIWPSGAEAKLFSGATEKDVDRLRAGGNRCLGWVEEAAAIPHLGTGLKHLRFGLRLGVNPHLVGSSTPRPTKDYRAFRSDPKTLRTHGTTEQATYLDPSVREQLYADYAGTRLGRQELYGELLEDIDGALWTLGRIDELRVKAHPDLVRIVIGYDPAVTSNADSDESGVIAVGREPAGELYVLGDYSLRGTPEQCARKVAEAYHAHEADAVVVEVNNGGDYLPDALRRADPTLAVRQVRATRGKRTRAEPISMKYEQGKAHHVGSLSRLEDQMTTWTPDSKDSPDRVDALVWACTELLGGADAGDWADLYRRKANPDAA